MYVREESPSRARLVKNRIVDCSTTDGDDVENLAKKKTGVNFPSLELSLPCFATLLCQIADRWPATLLYVVLVV